VKNSKKKRERENSNKALQRLRNLLERFNSIAVLLLVSPFFVIAVLNEVYLIAVVLVILTGFLVVLKRSDYHLVFIPPMIYALYQFMLLIIVPALINIYDYFEFAINGAGALLVIVLLCVTIAWVLMKIPEVQLGKLGRLNIGRLNISTTFAKGLGALLIIFILEPIVALLVSEDISTLSEIAGDKNVMAAIWLSIAMAFLATLISLLLGLPLGYLLARRNFTGRAIIQGIVDVPVVIPHTVAGIALLTVFGANGVIGAPLNEIGVKFVDAWPGIVVAMMFVSAPFVINSARDGFAAVDPRLEYTARSLGATRTQAFSRVALRLSLKPIITGAIMSWARAISEFGAVIILVYFPMIAPTLIYDRFTSFGLADSRPIAVLLVLVCLVVFIVLRSIPESNSIKNVPRRV